MLCWGEKAIAKPLSGGSVSDMGSCAMTSMPQPRCPGVIQGNIPHGKSGSSGEVGVFRGE